MLSSVVFNIGIFGFGLAHFRFRVRRLREQGDHSRRMFNSYVHLPEQSERPLSESPVLAPVISDAAHSMASYVTEGRREQWEDLLSRQNPFVIKSVKLIIQYPLLLVMLVQFIGTVHCTTLVLFVA
jgi:hypothetical protein